MAYQDICSTLLHNYLEFMEQGFEIIEVDGECQVTTPFWRPDGDHISIYAKASGESVRLTDHGETFDWLFSVGAEVDGDNKRGELMQRLATRYGITVFREELLLEANLVEIGSAVHRFLSAITSMCQLVLLRQQRGKTTFKDEVTLFLLENHQVFSSNYKVQGKTMEHKIDFYLDSGRNILAEALTATSLSAASDGVKKVSFEWVDIAGGNENAGYRKIVIIDDSGEKWDNFWSADKVRIPLEFYSDQIIRW